MSDAFVYVSDEELAYATDEERRAYELYVAKEHYLQNPDQWVDEALGEWLWSKQIEIATSVAKNRYTAVRACHGPGKSYTAARLIAHWIENHVPGEAFVISTAPTFKQVRGILWREIGKAHRKGNLIGELNQTEWIIPGLGLVGFGSKPADNDPDAFQGLHDKYVLIVIDEACGVVKAIFDAAETLMTNDNARVLAIGNPDDPQSHFAEVCKPGSGWNVIGISAFETPNLTGEWIPESIRPMLVQPTWVNERKKRWGESSPIYTSKVLGEFPEDASDSVIPYRWLSACDYVEPDEHPEKIELGLDVGASVEGDATVLTERRGNTPGRVWVLHTDESEEIVGTAIQAIHETGAQRIKVDVIGVGFGVAGHLRAQRKAGVHDCQVIPVNVSNKSTDPKRFPNLRSQIWWEVGREGMEQGLYSLADLHEDTKGELLAPKYKVNATGQNVVEPKADTRKRIDKSPDRADSFLLAFYEPAGYGKGKTTGKQLRAARLG